MIDTHHKQGREATHMGGGRESAVPTFSFPIQRPGGWGRTASQTQCVLPSCWCSGLMLSGGPGIPPVMTRGPAWCAPVSRGLVQGLGQEG